MSLNLITLNNSKNIKIDVAFTQTEMNNGLNLNPPPLDFQHIFVTNFLLVDAKSESSGQAIGQCPMAQSIKKLK